MPTSKRQHDPRRICREPARDAGSRAAAASRLPAARAEASAVAPAPARAGFVAALALPLLRFPGAAGRFPATL
eukprot:7213506-Prymnesium_polylepis.1